MITFDVKTAGMDKPLLPPDLLARFMDNLGHEVRRIIHDRVGMGRRVGGGSFPRYTKSYEKWKRKKGKGRTLYSEDDWLRLTGVMLGSHDITEVDADHFVLGFSNTEAALRAFTNNIKREFIGLSPEEWDEAINNTVKNAKAEGWF